MKRHFMCCTTPQKYSRARNRKAVTRRQQAVKDAKKCFAIPQNTRVIAEYGLFVIVIQVRWRFRRKFGVYQQASPHVPPPSICANARQLCELHSLNFIHEVRYIRKAESLSSHLQVKFSVRSQTTRQKPDLALSLVSTGTGTRSLLTVRSFNRIRIVWFCFE